MKTKKDIEKTLINCRKNLRKGRAIATGIGIFVAAIVDGKILLRKRVEQDSLYQKNLSGKWELPGGGLELLDFPQDPSDYQKAVLNCLAREMKEETGFNLADLNPALLPAWLSKEGLIDLAFVSSVVKISETARSKEMLRNNEIAWFDTDRINKVDITSPRMKFLIQQAINYRQ